MEMIVHRAGALTSVQDLGRPGRRADGVPVCGAMDQIALRTANMIVGNPQGAAALECTLVGPLVSFTSDAMVSVCGAEVRNLPSGRPIQVPRRQKLDLRSILTGCRAYLAVAGGIDVPTVLGSRSTDLRGGFGGMDGRRLRDADRMPIGMPAPHRPNPGNWHARSIITTGPALRILPGEHFELLPADFWSRAFEVARESDRVGVRLRAMLEVNGPGGLASRPMAPGTIQLPPSGGPIILGPDAGTIGGYASIAHVIASDLPRVAQLRPGDQVRFALTNLASAHAELVEQHRRLAILRVGVALR